MKNFIMYLFESNLIQKVANSRRFRKIYYQKLISYTAKQRYYAKITLQMIIVCNIINYNLYI